MLEATCLKNNVDVQRETTKYKHNRAAFVKAFSKVLAKQLFKSMDVQQPQECQQFGLKI